MNIACEYKSEVTHHHNLEETESQTTEVIKISAAVIFGAKNKKRNINNIGPEKHEIFVSTFGVKVLKLVGTL